MGAVVMQTIRSAWIWFLCDFGGEFSEAVCEHERACLCVNVCVCARECLG